MHYVTLAVEGVVLGVGVRWCYQASNTVKFNRQVSTSQLQEAEHNHRQTSGSHERTLRRLERNTGACFEKGKWK